MTQFTPLQAVQELVADAALLQQIMHGDAETEVDLGNGITVPTVANILEALASLVTAPATSAVQAAAFAVTSAFTMYLVDMTSAFAVTLPTNFANDVEIIIKDKNGHASAVNKLTAAGATVDGVANATLISVGKAFVRLRWSASAGIWSIVG